METHMLCFLLYKEFFLIKNIIMIQIYKIMTDIQLLCILLKIILIYLIIGCMTNILDVNINKRINGVKHMIFIIQCKIY